MASPSAGSERAAQLPAGGVLLGAAGVGVIL